MTVYFLVGFKKSSKVEWKEGLYHRTSRGDVIISIGAEDQKKSAWDEVNKKVGGLREAENIFVVVRHKGIRSRSDNCWERHGFYKLDENLQEEKIQKDEEKKRICKELGNFIG